MTACLRYGGLRHIPGQPSAWCSLGNCILARAGKDLLVVCPVVCTHPQPPGASGHQPMTCQQPPRDGLGSRSLQAAMLGKVATFLMGGPWIGSPELGDCQGQVKS